MADSPSQDSKPSIVGLSERLVTVLEKKAIPRGLEGEDELEREFVLLEAEKILKGYGSKFEACAHPWRSEDCCRKHEGQRKRLGCPECWRESKEWASVYVWGTQHNFDLVIRACSRKEDSLVVEAKLFSFGNGRQPNAEIQRFFGQCGLARAKHRLVIGFCGYRGSPREKFWQDTDRSMRWFRETGVKIIFRKID